MIKDVFCKIPGIYSVSKQEFPSETEIDQLFMCYILSRIIHINKLYCIDTWKITGGRINIRIPFKIPRKDVSTLYCAALSLWLKRGLSKDWKRATVAIFISFGILQAQFIKIVQFAVIKHFSRFILQILQGEICNGKTIGNEEETIKMRKVHYILFVKMNSILNNEYYFALIKE